MAKGKQSKKNKQQGKGKNRTPQLVFDDRGAFKKVTGLSKDPARRAFQLEQLLQQLGEDHQLKTINLAGMTADHEGLSKDLKAASERTHYLEERVRQLSSTNGRVTRELHRELRIEQNSSASLRDSVKLLRQQVQALENERRIMTWLAKTYPCFEYGHLNGIPTFNFAGLQVQFMQSREHCRFIVMSGANTPIKLQVQTIEVGTELTPDVFALLTTYARAVTPEGHAEFSQDCELQKLYAPRSENTSQGDRLQARCLKNAAAQRQNPARTESGLPKRQPGAHYTETVLTGTSDGTSQAGENTHRTQRNAATLKAGKLLRSIDDMRQQASRPQEQPTGDTQPTLGEMIVAGIFGMFDRLTAEIPPVFGTADRSNHDPGATAQGSTTEQ